MHYIWPNVTTARDTPFISRNAHVCAPHPRDKLKISPPTGPPQRDALARATNRALDTTVIVSREQIGPMIRCVVPTFFTPRLNWVVPNADLLCLGPLAEFSDAKRKRWGSVIFHQRPIMLIKSMAGGKKRKKGRAIIQQMNHTRCQDNLIESLKTKRRCLNIRPD